MNNLYLNRYAYPKTFISNPPAANLELVVTIPCFNEQTLVPCLESLKRCELPNGITVEVIVMVNEPEDTSYEISETNLRCYNEALEWAQNNATSTLLFYVFYEKLPHKHAGVGLARKAAMDEAVRRFECSNNAEGIILCFDADCTCDPNYLIEVFQYFKSNPNCPGASIYFEHPLEGELNDEVYEAIIDYELFLRYYVGGLRHAGFPHAYETIGSSMAVRSSAYQKQGGMNRRKAGEDFYFLHRIIPLGHFGEINTTRVLPSPRQSDRVPFGTGRAVNLWLKNHRFNTYAPQIFDDLKVFIKDTDLFYNADENRIEDVIKMQPESIQTFLLSIEGAKEISRINNNVSTLEAFSTQFFRWFDGFKVLKYVHHARDNYYPNIPVFDAAIHLLGEIYTTPDRDISSKKLLEIFRELDKVIGHATEWR